MANNSKPSDGFQPINHQHFRRQEQIQPNARIAPKLQQNPLNENNFGQRNCTYNGFRSLE